jgi:uncharacterized protein
MAQASREFQVFAKPAGARCNLGCHYCYYLEKKDLFPGAGALRMADDLLEAYIVQHIEAHPGEVINFSWHGGEPTVLGVDYFRKIVALQRKHQPPHRRITNGLQTNGTLLDEDWCRFLAAERFGVGLSLDGPREMHDRHRVTPSGHATHAQVMRGHRLLQKYRIPYDILCVVNSHNVQHPTQVYRFFKQIGARYLGFLPLVEPQPEAEGGVSRRTVPADAFGSFLCTIFDEWQGRDIGRVKVQIIEEAARTAFGQAHRLCIFRRTCGDVPVVEHTGDFFACDHFVDPEHRLGNIRHAPLTALLESPAQKAFGQAKLDTLPQDCRVCPVRDMCNGECPKNRFLHTPDGEPGVNYLCGGYKRFFTHVRPFVRALAALRPGQARAGGPMAGQVAGQRANPKTGRNDPCPCGSGRKYKQCCLGKQGFPAPGASEG